MPLPKPGGNKKLGGKPLFRFKGLSSKIYVAFLLAAAIPTSVAGLVGIFYSLETLKRETLLNLEQETASRAEAMTRFFDQLSSEMRYLVTSSALRDLALASLPGYGEGRQVRARVERDFAAFAQAYPYIYQIRYLDMGGREIVRVDSKEGLIVVVPEGELQDKSDRYYVQETLATAPGEIYVSPLDLNIERGEPEFPEKPVIRFGTAIAGADGRVQGMLIINLHAGVVLDQVRQMAEARSGNVYLFSRSGFYLSRSPDPHSDASFQMHSLEDLTAMFSRSFLAHVLSGAKGTDEQGEWIVAFAPVRKTVYVNGQAAAMEWAVVLAFPRGQLFAAVFNLYMLYGTLTAGLAVTAAAGFLLSRYLLRPLTLLSEETEEIARGNFGSRVEIKGEDEIADLGVRFNQMAEKLERSYSGLQSQRDNLEVEVEARTAALDRERRNLAAIIQNTADGILSVSREGIVDVANRAAGELFGAGAASLAGRPIKEFWSGWNGYVAEADPNPRLVTDQAGSRMLAFNIAPFMRDGAVQEYILVIRDVSEERRLQDERRELDRQIFQMEKMTSMGELAMGLAHEIGNPLAGMKAVVQALLEEAPEGDRSRLYLGRIENEVDRLSSFLRTFHGFAAPREMHPVPCRLDEVLEDVLLWTRKEARSNGIVIEYRHCSDGVPALWADPNQLKQVLLNLVINAIHAMARGGRITVGMCGPFAAEGWPGEGVPRVRFCVEDAGPGIPEDVLPRIFDPFFTTRADGSGLGLAVVKKIVMQHGADIMVHNLEGGGVRFEFIWPTASGGEGAGNHVLPPCNTNHLVAAPPH